MKRLTPPKAGEIDVSDRSKLVKLDIKKLDLPKPPGVNLDLPKPPGVAPDKAEEKAANESKGSTANLIAFDLDNDYDMEKFGDRFRRQFNSVNPMLFLNDTKTIKAA